MKRAIFQVYEGKCFACGTVLKSDDNSIDHMFPFSQGGLSELMNLQPLCKKHNETKHNAVPVEEEFTLHFGLVPVSDSFDGVVP
jgi:5-methylcytosine-specific restriction endonuclease McrA